MRLKAADKLWRTLALLGGVEILELLQVIPAGHGGLLDRCDSLFLVAVASAILLVAGGCIPFSW